MIEQIGTPTDIYRSPGSLFVADFIGSMNQLDGSSAGPDSVRLGELTLTSQEHGILKGASGVVAIRPEDVVPHARASNGSAPANSFNGKVREMEFLGSFWRARIEGGPLGGQALTADFSINAVRRIGLDEGKDITIELPAERLKLFPARDATPRP